MRYSLVRQVRNGPHWRNVSCESDRDDIYGSKAVGEIFDVSANKFST
jgi:hypothetical protein